METFEKYLGSEINESVSSSELIKALANLLEWAKGNRGSKTGNPYGFLEVKNALKVLAKIDGVKNYLDVDTKKLAESTTPYTGTHIGHTSSITHIQKVYGTNYKVIFSPSTGSWYVQGQQTPNGEWVPVTTPFPDKVSANDFAARLSKVETDQKKMLTTIGLK